jgi:hypothetical protein
MSWLDSITGAFGSGSSARRQQIAAAMADQQRADEQRRQYEAAYAQQQAANDEQNRLLAQQQADEAARAQAAADQAAQLEATRQQNVRQGRAGVDSSYSQFNDAYYSNLNDAFIKARTPGIDRDAARGRDKLTAALAGRGMGQSTVAAGKFADFDRMTETARGSLASEAQDYVNKLKKQIFDSKNSQYAAVDAGGDPALIASQAAANAKTYAETGAAGVAQPTQTGTSNTQTPQTQLGSLFSAALAPLANAGTAALNAPKFAANVGVTPTALGGGSVLYKG